MVEGSVSSTGAWPMAAITVSAFTVKVSPVGIDVYKRQFIHSSPIFSDNISMNDMA